MAQEPVDLEELVRIWVDNFPLDPEKKRELDEIQSSDINWSQFRIKHGPTVYCQQVQQQAPRTHILSTCHFTNNTGRPQTFALKTERRTTSVCSITMERAFTVGYSVDIKLGPPNPVVEANAGFKGEMTVTNTNEQTVEEELVWSVDSNVTVPPHRITTADLVLKEAEYSSHFKCETKFDGIVEVKLRRKRDKSKLMGLKIPARQILKAEYGFRVDPTGMYFVSEGACKCRFGIEQHVRLTQRNVPNINE